MPEISRFFGIVVFLNYNDHPPPHFHARYGSAWVVIDMRSLAVMAGSLPPRAMGLLLEWAARHREEILANWYRARRQEALLPVPPLD